MNSEVSGRVKTRSVNLITGIDFKKMKLTEKSRVKRLL